MSALRLASNLRTQTWDHWLASFMTFTFGSLPHYNVKRDKNSPNRGRAITSVMGKFLILHISSQVLAFNTDPQLLFPRIPGARQAGKFIAMILQLEELRHRPVITEPLGTRVPWIEAENRVWNIPLCEQNSSHFADKDQGLWSPMPQIY